MSLSYLTKALSVNASQSFGLDRNYVYVVVILAPD